MEKTTSLTDYLHHLQKYHSGIYRDVATWILRTNNPDEELENIMHCGCSVEDIVSSGTYNSLQDFYTAHEDEILLLYSDSDLALDESDPIRCLSCFAFEDIAWQIYYSFYQIL